jgi:hypothetical protein
MTTLTQNPGNNPAIQTSPVREIETVDANAPTVPESCHLCCDFSDPQQRDEHSVHLAIELISKQHGFSNGKGARHGRALRNRAEGTRPHAKALAFSSCRSA